MKLHILSDIHLEFLRDVESAFWNQFTTLGQADVCVVAGDLVPWFRGAYAGLAFLKRLRAAYPAVIYVMGNHEYYGGVPSYAEAHIADMEALGVHVLCDAKREVTINGQRFIGDTLWFRDDHEVLFNGDSTKDYIADFTAIRGFEPWVYERNIETEHFLHVELKSTDIVVTHHLPSEACVAPQFKGDKLNRYFVCAMDKLIVSRAPKLWIHGHSHSAIDTVVGTTRIYCNPFGYPGESSNPSFWDRVAIAVA